MNKSGSIFRRGEGLVWCSAIAMICWFVLSEPIDRILAAENDIEAAETLSFQHASRMARPITTSEALRFKSHVYVGPEAEALGPGDIQAALITLTKDHRAKLVDLRVLENDTSIETLEAKRFRLEVEGDLIAVTEILKSLGRIGQPVQIDDVALSPVGQQDRPDRRLRASFELSFWTAKVST